MKKEITFSIVMFTLIIAVGCYYLAASVIEWNPATRFTKVSLQLKQSSQLVTGTSVLIRGVKVGKVEKVEMADDGVVVKLRFSSDYKIPVSTNVEVEQLSMLGEPYVEFLPESGNGPYLRDGSTLSGNQVVEPVSIPNLFNALNSVTDIAQLGPLRDLTQTALEATRGAQTFGPQLSYAGQIFSATIASRVPLIKKMLENTQVYTADYGWLGPSVHNLAQSLPGALGSIYSAWQAILASIRDSDVANTINNDIDPLLDKLTPYLSKLLPDLQTILAPITPIITAADQTLPQINVSALLQAALGIVGSDGAARLTVTIPGSK